MQRLRGGSLARRLGSFRRTRELPSGLARELLAKQQQDLIDAGNGIQSFALSMPGRTAQVPSQQDMQPFLGCTILAFLQPLLRPVNQ